MRGKLGWTLGEGWARGHRLVGHTALLEVMEGSLRRSTWAGRAMRKGPREEQERAVFEMAAQLARVLADDYEEAARRGVDLPSLSSRRARFLTKDERASTRAFLVK